MNEPMQERLKNFERVWQRVTASGGAQTMPPLPPQTIRGGQNQQSRTAQPAARGMNQQRPDGLMPKKNKRCCAQRYCPRG